MTFKRKVLFRSQIMIIAIAVLGGCQTDSAPVSPPTIAVPKAAAPAADLINLNNAKNVVLLQVLKGHEKRVLDVVFSPQGEFLASSSQDMQIKLWDVQNGQELGSFQMSSVDMADIDLAIGKDLLASGEAIWDLASMQELHILERGSPSPASVAFSPDGSVLALGLFNEQITLWDVPSGKAVSTFERQEENGTKSMEFSPDGSLLAVGVIDGTVRLLDVASGVTLQVLKYSGETDIHGLSFSPDGNFLATGGRVLAVILWDVADGEVVRTFRLTDNAISLDFSPGGTILASAGGSEHEIRLWDVASGSLLQSLPHDDQITSVAFSADGSLLAVGCFDSNIYIWGIAPDP